MTPSYELHIKVEHISKVYTDYTGRFPVCSRSENWYIIIAYNCDYNTVIATPFRYCSDKHRLITYSAIMKRLKDRNMLVDLQILYNEASTEYKRIIKYECGIGITIGTTQYPS